MHSLMMSQPKKRYVSDGASALNWSWRMHSLATADFLSVSDVPEPVVTSSFRTIPKADLLQWKNLWVLKANQQQGPSFLSSLRRALRLTRVASELYRSQRFNEGHLSYAEIANVTSVSRAWHPTLRLWLRPRLLSNVVQILSYRDIESRNMEDTVEYAGTAQTLIAASSMTIAAALGFSRQYRSAFFIQQCLFKHIRRYVIALGVPRWDVFLLGVFPRFRSCWRALTRPSMEIYLHLLTEEVVADLGASRSNIKKVGGIAQWLAVVTEEVNWLEAAPTIPLEGAIAQLQKSLTAEVSRRLQTHQAWQRYSFEWARLYVIKSHQHGYYRSRRARSIKRRQTKKLIKRTKYRFWPS